MDCAIRVLEMDDSESYFMTYSLESQLADLMTTEAPRDSLYSMMGDEFIVCIF